MTELVLASILTIALLLAFLIWWIGYLRALSYLRLKRMERVIQLRMNSLSTVTHKNELYKVLVGILNNFCIMVFELVSVLPLRSTTSPGMLIASIENYVVRHVSAINGAARLWNVNKEEMDTFFDRYRKVLLDFQEELKEIMLQIKNKGEQLDMIELLIESAMDSIVEMVLDGQSEDLH